jgi:hypothetical protein
MRSGVDPPLSDQDADQHSLDGLEDAPRAKRRGHGLSVGLAFVGLLAASVVLWLLLPSTESRLGTPAERMAEVDRLNQEIAAHAQRMKELKGPDGLFRSEADLAEYEGLGKEIEKKVQRIWRLGGTYR